MPRSSPSTSSKARRRSRLRSRRRTTKRLFPSLKTGLSSPSFRDRTLASKAGPRLPPATKPPPPAGHPPAGGAAAPRAPPPPRGRPPASWGGSGLQVLARLQPRPGPLRPRLGVPGVGGGIHLDLLDPDPVRLDEAAPVGQVVGRHLFACGFRDPQEVPVRRDGGPFPQLLQEGLGGALLLPGVEHVTDPLPR